MPPFESISLLYPTFLSLTPGENPLSDGGKWKTYTRPPLMVAEAGGPAPAGSIHGTVDFPVCGSYYAAAAFSGPIIEAYGCTPISGLGAATEAQRVALWLGDPNDMVGYAASHGGGIGEDYFFRKYTGGGDFVGIGDVTNSTDDHPEKLGIRITPTRVEEWGYNPGGSGGWVLINYAADTDYRGAFFAALETQEQGGIEEVTFTCFGAGVPNRTQIYRVLRGAT